MSNLWVNTPMLMSFTESRLKAPNTFSISPARCDKKDFEELGVLPKASIIICFHDKENVSNVVRTVHSIIQRSPAHLLQEVILVDDRSRKGTTCHSDWYYTRVIYI